MSLIYPPGVEVVSKINQLLASLQACLSVKTDLQKKSYVIEQLFEQGHDRVNTKLIVEKLSSKYVESFTHAKLQYDDSVTGVMMHFVPKCKFNLPLFAIDIMVSPYAFSLFMMNVNSTGLDRQSQLMYQALLKSFEVAIEDHVKPRKIPAAMQVGLAKSTVCCAVIKGHEEKFYSALERMFHKMLLKLDQQPAEVDCQEFPARKQMQDDFLASMQSNCKEDTYFQRLYGAEKARYVIEDILLPSYNRRD